MLWTALTQSQRGKNVSLMLIKGNIFGAELALRYKFRESPLSRCNAVRRTKCTVSAKTGCAQRERKNQGRKLQKFIGNDEEESCKKKKDASLFWTEMIPILKSHNCCFRCIICLRLMSSLNFITLFALQMFIRLMALWRCLTFYFTSGLSCRASHSVSRCGALVASEVIHFNIQLQVKHVLSLSDCMSLWLTLTREIMSVSRWALFRDGDFFFVLTKHIKSHVSSIFVSTVTSVFHWLRFGRLKCFVLTHVIIWTWSPILYFCLCCTFS